MSMKRGKVSLLSFQDDEDDEVDETVVIKSKIDKKQKKLAYRKYDDEISLGCSRTEENIISYDEDELNSLRQSQLYTKERIAAEDNDFDELTIIDEQVSEPVNEDDICDNEIVTDTVKEVEMQGDDTFKRAKNKKVFFSDSVKTSVQSRREEIEREIQDAMDVGQEEEELNATVLKNTVGYTSTRDDMGQGYESENRGNTAMSMQSIIKLVGNSLDKLAGIHNSNKDNLSRITDNLDNLVASMDQLNADMTTSVSTLNYLLELQLFVTEVVSMLREKVELLKAYKSEYLTLIANSHKETEMKYYIKQEDLLYILQQQGDIALLNSGSYKCQHMLHDLEVDEFGRMLNDPNQFKQRLDAYFPSLVPSVNTDSITLEQLLSGIDDEVASMVGLSTNPLICTILEAGITSEAVLDKIRLLFGDCRTELHSIAHILSKFQQFKSNFLSEYNRAFMSYSLPGLLLPMIEYDLVVSAREHYVINEREWHHAVRQYTMDQEHNKTGDNIDDQLLSTLVTTASLLYLQELVVSGLNILNRQHCVWIGQFLQQILIYNPSPVHLGAVTTDISNKFNLFWTDKLLFPVLKSTPVVSKWGCYYYHRSFVILYHTLCNLEYLLPVLNPDVLREMIWSLLFGNKNVLSVVVRVLNTAVTPNGGIVSCLVKIGQILALVTKAVSDLDGNKKRHLLFYINTVTSTSISVAEIVKMLRDISSQY